MSKLARCIIYKMWRWRLETSGVCRAPDVCLSAAAVHSGLTLQSAAIMQDTDTTSPDTFTGTLQHMIMMMMIMIMMTMTLQSAALIRILATIST